MSMGRYGGLGQQMQNYAQDYANAVQQKFSDYYSRAQRPKCDCGGCYWGHKPCIWQSRPREMTAEDLGLPDAPYSFWLGASA